MFTRNPSIVARFTFTVLAVTLATLLRFALASVIGEGVPFIFYYPTVVLCAWFGGWWPGLLSTALSGAIAWYAFIPPQYSFKVSDPTAVAQLVVFLLAGTLISSLAESLHRARRKTEESETREREQRERFRVTLASIGDAVISTDMDGLVTFINPIAESLTGWQQETAVGRSLREVFNIVNEQTHQTVENPALRAIREGVIFGLANHTILIAKDGTEIPIDDSGAPIKDSDGKILGAVLIFRDITERRRVEKERALLAGIVESSDDAIIGKSLDGVIETWNVGAERLFGFSADEAIGQSITIIIPPDKLDEERLILERLRQGERIEHFETVRLSKSGKVLDISLTVSPIRGAAGHIIGASKIARDIGERRRAEQERELLLAREQAARNQAEVVNRLKDEFLATISHELRTPLNAILGWATLLRRSELGEAGMARALETIERSAKTQAQLIEDMLDVSRITAGKLRLEVKPTELIPVINAAIDSVQHAAQAKEIQLQMILDPAASYIQGDAARLQQVIWNLLSNAVKFTPKGGLVQVKLERADSQALITVSDTGEGIAPEFLPYVFDRFQQADGTSTRKHSGLGLGLAIARHLVESHGGTIQAHSAGLGEGASFTVRLPLVAVRANGPSAITHRENVPQEEPVMIVDPLILSGLRILAVDDELDTREMVKAVLEQYGADVTTAASVREVFEVLVGFQPDVLVCDIGMPEEDGYSLIQKVRRLKPEEGGNTPAIALTGYVRVEERMRALEVGYQMFVPKPIEADELVLMVANLVGRTNGDLKA
jgi:PAS domain S-box-containing protein